MAALTFPERMSLQKEARLLTIEEVARLAEARAEKEVDPEKRRLFREFTRQIRNLKG